MVKLVELIEMTKSNIEELKLEKKENEKTLATLMQEQENITKNIAMFEETLKSLTAIKDKEVSKEIKNEEKPKKTESKKRRDVPHTKNVIAYDEKGNKFAEYASEAAAARDLGINPKTLSWRVRKTPIEKQIKLYGFAVKEAV